MLDYGDVLCRLACKDTLERLDILYYSAIGFATNAPYKTHHRNLYSSIGWPPLHARGKPNWLTFISKPLLGFTPPYLKNCSSVYNMQLSNHTQLKGNILFGRMAF